ncbi:MAG: hypothetical protein ACPG06_04515 [Alphaproteobacteria bacterium]
MALTNQEVVQAAPSIIDTDGTFTQFSKAAIIDFADRLIHVELGRFFNNVIIRLYENNDLQNGDGFVAINLDIAQSAVDVEGEGGAIYELMLSDFSNTSTGLYVFSPAMPLPPHLAVRLTLAGSFQNPATANNPAATINFSLVYYASTNAHDAGHTHTLGARVLTLAEEGWVREVDI